MALAHQMKMLTSDGRAGARVYLTCGVCSWNGYHLRGAQALMPAVSPEPVYLRERGPLWGNGHGFHTLHGAKHSRTSLLLCPAVLPGLPAGIPWCPWGCLGPAQVQE